MPGRRAKSAVATDEAAAPPSTTVAKENNPSPSPSEAFTSRIPPLFSTTQHSLATHRKSLITLHKLFLSCVAISTPSDDGESVRLTGEREFGTVVREMVARIVAVKKGQAEGDRSVKFLVAFVGFAVEYDEKKRLESHPANEDDEDEDDMDDSPSSRLVSQLLAFLLRGFTAKNKTVRFRCVQMVALLVNCLGELDDETYQSLKTHLLSRVRDKEPSVRMQAVVALAKLQGAEEEDDDASSSSSEAEDDREQASESDEEEEESDEEYVEKKPQQKGGKGKQVVEEKEESVRSVLVEVLGHDSAAEVRRASLLNLLPSPRTLSPLLTRTLDIDPINRRAAYTHVLSEVPFVTLSKAQREVVVKRGLGDREEAVRKAARGVVGRWGDEVGGVEELLAYFDLAHEEGKVAEQTLFALFESRTDLMANINFDEEYYTALSPSRAFLARSYFQYLRQTSNPILEDLQPVMTRLAYLISEAWTMLSVELEQDEVDDRKIHEGELVVRELVRIGREGDYGDEMGRRVMFDLMRQLLGHPSLPPALIPQCLDVLLKGGITERDFVQIVVEIIQVLRADSALLTSESELDVDDDDDDDDDDEDDADEDDEQEGGGRKKGKGKERMRARSKGPAHVERRKELDLRCLAVCRALLERVMGAIMAENSMVHGLVIDLIVPAVRSKDREVRAEGLLCLGLGCLVDKASPRLSSDRSMALDSFELLARQSQETEGPLQIKILQTLFDILILHGINFGVERKFGPDVILGFLLNSLEQEEPEVASTAVVGIAKLMLAGMVKDEEILSRLVLLYFASETADNPELRQCLSFFFPVYCYSNPLHQRKLSNISLPALMLLKGVYDDLSDKTAMVAPLQIALQLVDWTDPQKTSIAAHIKADEDIHLDLAVRMVKALYTHEEKDDRKLLCQILPKLYMPEDADSFKVKSLLMLITALKDNRPLADATSRNALVRFETAVKKAFAERVDTLTGQELQDAAEIQAARAFMKQHGVEDLEGEAERESEEDEDDGEEEGATPEPEAEVQDEEDDEEGE